ncbi:MAG TPA: M1 family metallopeptidase [Vicinamibacterales bacterium]|nr:M1 family metallopeptidase [Vicinamibacterales bacterium]
MRHTAHAALACMLVSSPVLAQPPAGGTLTPPRSPRNANYTIAARLDPATRTITATETIVWRNITAHPAPTLQFHLYWNAWKNAKSTYMREQALARLGSEAARAADEWARMEVSSVRVGGVDRAASRRFVAPDDDNANDETVMEVPLTEPVAPGGTATIDVAWTAHVPRTFARTGAVGHFFFIAQWFPKLGVLQDAGWNCHQFHFGTEFFSDYGVYDVSLTVPTGWPVGATGIERESRNEGPQTVHRFYQEDVHDFVWTTSPDYVVRTARFEHATLPPVEMRLLLQPEHERQAERHFDATRTALKYYGEWFGPYPYGHITIVDPAFQSGAGGMEYPTLFTAGTRWLAPAQVTTPEGVTVHEAGHQFWYGIVGTNEFEDAWMDEGFNTFSTARAIEQQYPLNFLALRYFGGFVPWVFREIPLSRETEGNRLAGYRRDARSDAQSTPTFRYFPASGGSITYNKTALWLNTLERLAGWPALQRTLTTYFAHWQFRHPKPDDFFAVAKEVIPQAGTEATPLDLDDFFNEVYRSSNVFDYSIDDLASVAESGRFHTTVVVRRRGEARWRNPVVVTKFRNGAVVVESGAWDPDARWKAYVYDMPAQAISAQVDPQRVLLLDVNYTNNSRTLEPRGGAAATKWSTQWIVWLQDCLLSWATLA